MGTNQYYERVNEYYDYYEGSREYFKWVQASVTRRVLG